MCTYNSNTPYFRAVLQRISEEVPVHCFIAVDRLSSDGTVNRILEVFPEATILQSRENLGKARKIGIDHVDTSFFIFVDSDVLLLKGWYEYVKGLMKNGVGAVACFAQDEGELNRGLAYDQTLPRLVFSSKNNVDSQRGWTYATLIRKEAVTNWEPNRTLAAGEDHELLRQVATQGFLWVTSYFVFAKHLQPVQSYFDFYQNLWKKQKWNAAGLRYIKFTKSTPNRQLFTSLLTFWAGIKMAFLFRNAFLIPYYFVYCLASNYGYANWRKELFLRR
jgi:glycosyltransferase involved in cell wall biosynthesis